MKIVMIFALGIMLISFVGAQSIVHPHLDHAIEAHEFTIMPPSQPTPSMGGGNGCKTLWAWDGEQYIKRDVVKKQRLYKGTNMQNIKGNIQIDHVTEDGYVLNIVTDGRRCQALNRKPMTQGTIGVSEDISVLPYQWYKGYKR